MLDWNEEDNLLPKAVLQKQVTALSLDLRQTVMDRLLSMTNFNREALEPVKELEKQMRDYPHRYDQQDEDQLMYLKRMLAPHIVSDQEIIENLQNLADELNAAIDQVFTSQESIALKISVPLMVEEFYAQLSE